VRELMRPGLALRPRLRDARVGGGVCADSRFGPRGSLTAFRWMKVTVTLGQNGQKWSAPVVALPKLPINNFTGFGLVNADAATRR